MLKKILVLALVVGSSLALILSVRGLPGNPTTDELLTTAWRDNGPFELSPERGRFALTYSIVENHSVFFPPNLARFIVPDVGYRDGKFVSLFAPALSFIVAPGYMLGKMIGMSQIGTSLVVCLFAVFNIVMIRKISMMLGANPIAATISGLLFVFATPAFTYAVSLYQHHVTTALFLLAIYVLLKSERFWSSMVVFFLFAFGVALDYPNFFMMLPLLLFIGFYRVLHISEIQSKIKIHIRLIQILSGIGAILPLVFFLWFNTVSYGKPTNMLGGSSITAVHTIDEKGNLVVLPTPEKVTEKTLSDQSKPDQSSAGSLTYFQTRNILRGLTIHIIGKDRGVLYYAPIVFFGALGFFYGGEKNKKIYQVLGSFILLNVLLYSMWGDPWGGWAFGSRYLIPSYAVLCILLSMFLTRMRKNIFVLLFLFCVSLYCIAVNTIGALTSSRNPPQVQVLQLESLSGRTERYMYTRNMEMLDDNRSKSLAFVAFAHRYLTAWQYTRLIGGALSVSIGILFYILFHQSMYEKS